MSKRVKNTSIPKWAGCYTGKWSKPSNNAKKNKALNKGITAATHFYIWWNL